MPPHLGCLAISNTRPRFVPQVYQAMSIKTEAEVYLRWQGALNALGEGHTMGALYWQLNDIWQAPTWSSIGQCGLMVDVSGDAFSEVNGRCAPHSGMQGVTRPV